METQSDDHGWERNYGIAEIENEHAIGLTGLAVSQDFPSIS